MKEKLYRLYLLFVILCPLLPISSHEVTASYRNLTTREKMQLIDPIDRQKLEDFFRCLFLDADFSLTLFGHKPMGLVNLLMEISPSKSAMYLVGWKTWQKYQVLFLPSNYSLSYFEGVNNPRNFFFGFLLINKDRCQQVINQNLSLFHSYFKSQNIDDIIAALSQPNFFSANAYRDNYHLCLGLLFGYGENSASLFERRILLYRRAAQLPYELSQLDEKYHDNVRFMEKSKIHIRTHQQPLGEILCELNQLEKRAAFVPLTKQNLPLCPIKIHGFVGFGEDPQLEALQVENEALIKKLVEINYADNFLEIILNRLAG